MTASRSQLPRTKSSPARSASPRTWLEHCARAERVAGRRTTYRWGPRVADADILLLGEHGEIRVHDEDLIVPHPELGNRAFEQQLLAAAGYAPA